MSARSAFLAGLISMTLANFVSAGQRPEEFDGPGYRVLLPSGVTAATDAKVDFDITTFKKSDGTVLLSAYAGLHPDFNPFGSSPERRPCNATIMVV